MEGMETFSIVESYSTEVVGLFYFLAGFCHVGSSVVSDTSGENYVICFMLGRFVLAHFYCKICLQSLLIFSVEVQGRQYSVKDVDFLYFNNILEYVASVLPRMSYFLDFNRDFPGFSLFVQSELTALSLNLNESSVLHTTRDKKKGAYLNLFLAKRYNLHFSRSPIS